MYPPIGIARVGNAPGVDDYTLAPETIGGLPDARGGYQTANGAIKRQAARFRLYAKLRSGGFAELTAGEGVSIEWRVEVANLKAGWYQFKQAMDLPPPFAKSAQWRNADHRPRADLDIRPVRRVIGGTNLSGPAYRFDDGQFLGSFVPLGELRTDEAGRLLFLGGSGVSASFPPGMRPTTFANNDRWHDDLADGPVRARVTIGGTTFEAEPGYVVVTPPNYAPGLSGLVTMDDTVRETFMAQGWLPRPTETNFSADVWPIFERLTRLQWINHGLFVAHGIGSPLNAASPEVVTRLADASAENRPWRERVFALFRAPGPLGPAPLLQLPYIYGDLYGESGEAVLTLLSVTMTMHEHLRRWKEGDFASDWAGPPIPVDFAGHTPEGQVAQLTRAGLSECLGGPFHPGIEISWPLRRPELWALHHRPEIAERGLYRLNLIAEGEAVRQDFGATLTPEVCLGPDGATGAAGPGALTRWLGVPWQTDEASCNSSADYEPSTFLSMPSFWGARVPEQVLSSESWTRVTEVPATPGNAAFLQRLKHAFHREDWLRDVRGRTYFERIDNMVRLWATLGVLEPRPTPDWLVQTGFPTEVHLETGRDDANPGTDQKPKLVAIIEALAGDVTPPTIAAPSEGPAGPQVHVPPRHRFRQGEI
ncbi:LodA/GoxA family CTQ-dependent oxidase [Microvirga lotononidis]|uniref:LodA/GoxA family CTQ-dependent oxidase n=1 Tax=Microvirga lotononidis TaxID=864069 RepID=UPI001FD9F045|nr:LodA/GoxA family CTQ-dependent oxidase [Microvirga lotononidis]WQO30458.1 LodA/GoxA family CTQ-dependent oxidase [Microvirga lotononidis]